MFKHKKLFILTLLVIIFLLTFFALKKTEKDSVFQVSTINSLLEGVYDGNISIKGLSRHGNTGIGTFNALDGEMVALDGKFYQVKSDGKAYLIDKKIKTPFAAVSFFESDKTLYFENVDNYEQLQAKINEELETENIFYVLKIKGEFDYIKTRSVPAQSRPYKPLVEVVKNQPEFEFSNIKGTIVGFILPPYVEKINVPGYHLHFITQNRDAGGHLLECKIKQAQVDIDYTHSLILNLLNTEDFYKTNAAKNSHSELNQVETSTKK